MNGDDAYGAPERKRPLRRGVKIAGGAAFVIALAGVSGIVFLRSPAGLDFIERAANGAKAGRLGTLSLKNLSGDPFSHLHADRIALSDVNGEWLVAENTDLKINAWALLGRVVQINSAGAEKVTLLRRPTLSKSDDKKNKPAVDFDLRKLTLPQILVADGVAGPASQLKLDASILVRRNKDSAAHLDLRCITADSDVLVLNWTQIHDGVMQLDANGRAKTGGFFANLLETPKGADLILTAKANGDPKAGSGAGLLTIGGAEAMKANAQWRDGSLSLSANGDFKTTALTKGLAERLGGPFDVNLKLAPDGVELQNVVLDARFANLSAHASGLVNSKERTAPKGLDVTLDSSKLNALGDGFEWGAGAAHADGKVYAADNGYAFKGRAQFGHVSRAGINAKTISGPLLLTMNDAAIGFQGTLDARGVSAANRELAGLLGRNAAIDAAGRYMRKDGEVRIELARITGTAATLQAAGELNPDGPARFEGIVTINDLTAARPDLKGRVDFRFGAARLNRDDPLAISGQGVGSKIAGASQLARLLGPKPHLQFEALAPQGGGWSIERAKLEGDGVRIGAKGEASTFGALNVDFEAYVRGPYSLGQANITGDIEAFGKVAGTQKNPRLTFQASAPGLSVAGQNFTEAVLEADMPDLGKALAGRATLEAALQGAPVNGSTEFALSKGRTALSNIDARWGAGGRLNGAFAFGGGAPMDGMLAATGPVAPFMDASGAMTASLKLSGQGGRQLIDFSAVARDITPQKGKVALERLSLRLQGPEDQLKLTASATGIADKPFALRAQGPIVFTKTTRTASIAISGKYGDDSIASRGPVEIATGPQLLSIKGVLNVGAGGFDVDWRRTGDALDAKLNMTSAPASLLGYLSPRLRLGGDVSGKVELTGSRKALRGGGQLDMHNLGPDGAKGSGLDGALSFTLSDGRIISKLDAKSASGLVIKGDSDIPATASAQPFNISFDPKSKAAGHLYIQGPAKDGWRIFGPTQQSLDGAVQLNATLAGTIGKPELSGAGTLTSGTFEDSATGIKLRDVAADMRFAGSTLNITSITARDKNGGSATAQGAVIFAAAGPSANVAINMHDLKFLDRDEVRATGSGALTYTARPGEAAKLSGKVVADRFDLAPLESNPSMERTIPVTHVNMPARYNFENRMYQSAGKPLELDIAMSAPARLFLRGRGLESEWSLNSRLRGTLSQPVLSGQAELIRGDYDLLGKRFDLDSGRIDFNGSPQQARLSISGSRAVTGLTAYVKVTGTVGRPEIDLTSSPSLPNDEVLARVLYDRSTAQLSALEAAQLASGIAALSGNNAFDIAGAFRSVGLDRVRVDGDSNGAASISGGKYVAQNVYVEITGGAAGEPAAQVEWEPKRNLSLVSRFSGTQTSRFSVRWKKDY